MRIPGNRPSLVLTKEGKETSLEDANPGRAAIGGGKRGSLFCERTYTKPSLGGKFFECGTLVCLKGASANLWEVSHFSPNGDMVRIFSGEKRSGIIRQRKGGFAFSMELLTKGP